MGTPKGNQKGFRFKQAGQIQADAGAGMVVTSGQDSRGDQVRILGRWTDTGVPGLGTVAGTGFTVVRDNVGIWTVTFTQGFAALQSAHANVLSQATGTPLDQVGQVSTFTAGVAGACTLRILCFDSAGAADLAAGDFMCFEAVLASEYLD